MSLIVVETRSAEPITDEFLVESGERVLPCLDARDAHWQYSLLSLDRRHMICVFDAPDVAAVQDSYRKADVGFGRMWSAERRLPEGALPLRNEPILKVFEGTYPEGFTEELWDQANRHILPCYAAEGVEWVQSYVSRDRTRVVCEINASDAEIIREAHRRFNIPFDRVWSAMVLKP